MTKPIIRSARLSLKFANTGKKAAIAAFIGEYARVVRIFVPRFWEIAKKGRLDNMPKTALCREESWLSARALQCAAKQAAGIVNGTLAKNKRRLFVAAKLEKEGQPDKAAKLREKAAAFVETCPEVGSVQPQLDARFFVLEKGRGSFDDVLTLKSIGSPDGKRGAKIVMPLRRHKHFNRLADCGKILNAVKLSEAEASFAFDVPAVKAASGKTLGIDVGQNAVFSTSRGESVQTGRHGWSLKAICERLARRKRGSKGFGRAELLRKNFTGEVVNRLNLNGVGILRIEKIRGMKNGRRLPRKLSHWSYRDLFAALKSKASLRGVRVEEVNPAFTSQRCSCCGWVRKRNRKGLEFSCGSCGNTANADLNAARNIALSLAALPPSARTERKNLKGFFWAEAHEPILREAQKPTNGFRVRSGAKIFQ